MLAHVRLVNSRSHPGNWVCLLEPTRGQIPLNSLPKRTLPLFLLSRNWVCFAYSRSSASHPPCRKIGANWRCFSTLPPFSGPERHKLALFRIMDDTEITQHPHIVFCVTNRFVERLRRVSSSGICPPKTITPTSLVVLYSRLFFVLHSTNAQLRRQEKSYSQERVSVNVSRPPCLERPGPFFL